MASSTTGLGSPSPCVATWLWSVRAATTMRADSRQGVYVFPDLSAPLVSDAETTAAGAGPNAYFGISVAMSGQTALVGAYRDDNSGRAEPGAGYI